MSAAKNQEISIVVVDALDAELNALLADSDSDLSRRYPSEHIYTITPGEPDASDAVFLIARNQGVAVACGALLPSGAGTAEIKRMFVRADARRGGVARKMLAKLESAALQMGCKTIRLETGTRQLESVAFYESAGYRPIPCFGEYAGDPYSLCYEKCFADGGSDS